LAQGFAFDANMWLTRILCVACVVNALQLHKKLDNAKISPFIVELRTELEATEKLMQDTAAGLAGRKDANRMLQSMVETAFKEMSALTEVVAQLEPQLEACKNATRPMVRNTSAPVESQIDQPGYAMNSLRAEMYELRGAEVAYDNAQALLTQCRAECKSAGVTLLAKKQQQEPLADPLIPASADFDADAGSMPLLPNILNELKSVEDTFGKLNNASHASAASASVLEGMSAEAMKALFNLQDEVAEMQHNLTACGNSAQPFVLSTDIEEGLDAHPELSQAMVERARAETDAKQTAVQTTQNDILACKAECVH